MKTISVLAIKMDITKTSEGHIPKGAKILGGLTLVSDPENPVPPNAILNMVAEHDVKAEMEVRKFVAVKVGAVISNSAVYVGQIGRQDYIYDVTAPA